MRGRLRQAASQAGMMAAPEDRRRLLPGRKPAERERAALPAARGALVGRGWQAWVAVAELVRTGAGSPRVLHGSLSFVLQDEDGQITPAHSTFAGLDYPG